MATSDPAEVLRRIWEIDEDHATDLDAIRAPQKTCRNMKHVSFDGMVATEVDLREAWRARLAAEGKLDTSGGTLRDLVLGRARAADDTEDR